jgi:energy-coupled thiamine transporter ThiT
VTRLRGQLKSAVDPKNLIQVILAEGKNMSTNVSRFSTKIIAEIITFVALSTALSYIKVFSLPQGGSVTAGSMVPIIWLSLRRGPKIGLFVCALYGLVQLAVEPFVYYPTQVLLDYPIAFGALGLAGFFKNRPTIKWRVPIAFDILVALLLSAISLVLLLYEFALYALREALFFLLLFTLALFLLAWLLTKRRQEPKETVSRAVPALIGAAVGITGRFVAHFVSGIVFFPQFAPEGMSPIVYSAIYNGSYMIPEFLVTAYFIYLIAKSGLLRVYE